LALRAANQHIFEQLPGDLSDLVAECKAVGIAADHAVASSVLNANIALRQDFSAP
jgi:hypothetical protein